MSQPEMQPEGVPPEGQGSGAGSGPGAGPGAGAGPGTGPGARPGDLTGRAFPQGDWGEPAERLDELYRWVERGALDTAEWYLTDRGRKRLGARLLRAGAALGAVGGGVLPLLDLAGALGPVATWGFVSLLAGVACVGCDRFFGLTSGWMRDVATAQAVQRRLQVLQFDWASESVREVLGPTEGTAGEAAERCLGVLRKFTEDVTDLVRAETSDWMVEFRAGPVPLAMQAMPPGSPPREASASPGRFPMAPGARPNMPRQRPPEPR
ncbi:SLATT domain-containing protein [Streptomyces sp. NPDC058308]|uniref:SLATT domain-containing protein n=1 Tax=Streptomyces sp. NPDC058308 TaxID=3346440 RepID=UPI0036E1D9F4